jgi:hypothetical protein
MSGDFALWLGRTHTRPLLLLMLLNFGVPIGMFCCRYSWCCICGLTAWSPGGAGACGLRALAL